MNFPVSKYDSYYDVLHIYLSPKCNWYEASSEEDVRDIYVIKTDDTDEIVGFKILDYHKNVDKARAMYPDYDFSLPDN